MPRCFGGTEVGGDESRKKGKNGGAERRAQCAWAKGFSKRGEEQLGGVLWKWKVLKERDARFEDVM